MSVEEIREVQTALRSQGFVVEVDGMLGPRTREALIAFQQRHGFHATGQIDQQTTAALGVKAGGGATGQGGATTGRSPSSNPSGAEGSKQAPNSSQPGTQQPAQQHSGQPGTTGQSSGQSGKAAPPHMNAPQNNAPQNNAPAQQGGSNRLQGQSR